MRHGKFTIMFLMLSLASTDSFAQWTNVAANLLAPEQQYVGAICFHDGVVWAGTTTLQYSNDSGKTWNVVSTFPPRPSPRTPWAGISDIAIYDPLHVLVSYIDTNVQLYLTSDGGQTWTKLNPPGQMFVQAAFGGSASILYALSENRGFGPSFYSSMDGGATWNSGSVSTTHAMVSLCFAIAPGKPNTVSSLIGDLSVGPWGSTRAFIEPTVVNGKVYVAWDRFPMLSSYESNAVYSYWVRVFGFSTGTGGGNNKT